MKYQCLFRYKVISILMMKHDIHKFYIHILKIHIYLCIYIYVCECLLWYNHRNIISFTLVKNNDLK